AFKSLRRSGEVLELSEDEADGGEGSACQPIREAKARSGKARAKRARQAEKEEAQQAAATAMAAAAEASFRALAQGSSISVEALRAALLRFRVPPEVCKPEEAEDLLALAAEEAGVDPGPLSFDSFKKLFDTLNLKVTKDGRVW
ncbi:unnamed protein product, partial [Effrenium voratum]